MLIRLRKWIIRKVAGDMGVVLNAEIGIEENGEAYISYAGTKGGMCDLSGVK